MKSSSTEMYKGSRQVWQHLPAALRNISAEAADAAGTPLGRLRVSQEAHVFGWPSGWPSLFSLRRITFLLPPPVPPRFLKVFFAKWVSGKLQSKWAELLTFTTTHLDKAEEQSLRLSWSLWNGGTEGRPRARVHVGVGGGQEEGNIPDQLEHKQNTTLMVYSDVSLLANAHNACGREMIA